MSIDQDDNFKNENCVNDLRVKTYLKDKISKNLSEDEFKQSFGSKKESDIEEVDRVIDIMLKNSKINGNYQKYLKNSLINEYIANIEHNSFNKIDLKIKFDKNYQTNIEFKNERFYSIYKIE